MTLLMMIIRTGFRVAAMLFAAKSTVHADSFQIGWAVFLWLIAERIDTNLTEERKEPGSEPAKVKEAA